jgi:hypothetical protein
MSCGKPTSFTYAVYELWPDGTEHDTKKSFQIDQQISNAALTKRGWDYRIGNDGAIDNFAIVLTMFETCYKFDVGLSGFTIKWEDNNTALVNWGGPREPAIRCGGDWWKLRRVI